MHPFTHLFSRGRINAVIVCLVCAVAHSASAQVASTWDGTNGLWNDASRWDTNPLFPNNGNGGQTYDPTINAGIVTLDQNIIVEQWTFGGGTVGGSFELTVNNGAIIGNAAGADMTHNLTTLSLDGASTISQLGNLVVNPGATINLAATGTLDLQSDATIGSAAPDANGGTFNNQGIVTKSSGAINRVNMPFNNSGTVESLAGLLRLSSGGVHTGTFQTNATGRIQLGLNHTLQASSLITGNILYGPGTTHILGTVNLAPNRTSDFVLGRTEFDAGAQVNNAGVLLINGGVAKFSTGNVVTAVSHSFTSRGGAITGSDTVNVTGLTTFLRGEMRGPAITNANGGLDIGNNSGFGLFLRERTLNASGSSTWFGTGDLTVSDGGTFVNLGTLDVQNDIRVLAGSGGGALQNQGILNKTAGTGTTAIAIAFDNAGTVNYQTPGVLDLSGGGDHSGAYNASTSATIQFNGGTHNLNASTTFNGAWSVRLLNGTLNINDPTVLAELQEPTHTFEFNAGILDITNTDLTIDSQGLLGTSTILNANRQLTVAGTLQIGQSGAGVVEVAEDGTLSTGNLNVGGAASGQLNVTGNGMVNVTGTTTIAVNGTLLLSAGTWTTGILNNTAGGSVTFTGGTMHVGTFNGDLVNDGGTLAPGNSPGSTTVNGDYTHTSGGTLEIEIGGLVEKVDYDQLIVEGLAALSGGTLDLLLLDGFEPMPGQVFDILLANTITGMFTTINLPIVADPPLFGISVIDLPASNQQALRVTVLREIPEPATLTVLAAGLLALFSYRRPLAVNDAYRSR